MEKKKDITKEDVENFFESQERKSSFTLPMGHLGNGVYRISDGCLTNKQGWDSFQKALLKQGLKQSENETGSPDSII